MNHQTRAVRMHGAHDLRCETFDLPPINDDEILADVVTNSICMSSHKALLQGSAHKRVPGDIERNPVIMGHEFCGRLLATGASCAKEFGPGEKYAVQPAINYPGRGLEAPGYAFPFIGGLATRIVIPREVIERQCLLRYDGDGFFPASLAEPVSCVIGAFNSQYHLGDEPSVHHMGIAENGCLALLGGAGPMGLCAIDVALHGPRRPQKLVITDIDSSRLARAKEIFPPEYALKLGINLFYINTRSGDPVADLLDLSGGAGFNDIFIFAPEAALIQQASHILGTDGCMNFFAGPARADFSAPINFYHVHYSGHHIAGSSGGTTGDMRAALDLMAGKKINPAVMVTHIGGLDSAADTIRRLPRIPGGKKLIYPQIEMPLTAIEDFHTKGEKEPLFAELAEITDRNNHLWSVEAENALLRHFTKNDD